MGKMLYSKEIGLILGLCLLLGSASVQAQQDAMYSQYMFNTLSVNPAYAASTDNFYGVMLYRNQWVGFEGAPTSMTFSAQGPLMRKSAGIGITLVQDKIGPQSTSYLVTDFAYKIQVGREGYLSMGVRGGIDMQRTNLGELTQIDGDAAYNNVVNETQPNFGTGVYYYNPKFYAGFAIPRLLETSTATGSGEDNVERHFFIIGGYVHELNPLWKLKPSFLFKSVGAAPASIDVTLMATYKDKINGGLSYRINDAVVFMTQMRVLNRVWFGYAFDMTFSDLGPYNSGTHEILLSWDVALKKYGIVKSPRYF